MKTIPSLARMLGLALLSAAGAVLFCSCEEHGDPQVVSTSSTVSTPAASASSLKPTSGKWTGTSGPNHADSTLTLSESEGAVSGTLKWPGQSQSVTGIHSGALVRVQISCGDTWRMSYNGTKLSGTGTTEDGSSYGLMFKRE